jgi:peptidoglycan/xylan/chitin deacetylase (PgdA/CDA1 family)
VVLALALLRASWTVWQPQDTFRAEPVGAETTTARPATASGDGPAPPTSPTTSASTTAPTPPTSTTTPTPALTVAPLERRGQPLPVVHRVRTFDPVVFLTVDDGVVQDPAVVEFVRARSLPITMFLTADYVGDGSYFRELIALGGEVGSHSITHRRLVGVPEPDQRREVCGPSERFAQLFGPAPRYFRPPYGAQDATTLTVAAGCGMKAVVHWNATMEGARFERVGGGFLQAGDIVLLHFKDGLTTDLQLLLDQMAALGLRPARLGDYLDAAPVN